MNRLKQLLFLMLVSAPLAPSFAAQGSYDVECANLVRECMDSSEARSERDSCFYSALQQASCRASTIESTLQRRWSLASSPLDDGEQVDALLGAQPIDQACVSNCDNRWLGMIINSAAPSIMRKTIEACLDACVEKPELPFFHP